VPVPEKEAHMLPDGRRQRPTPEGFLIQISALHDPRLDELAFVESLRLATEQAWEPGTDVEVKSPTGEARGRARVVYCKAVGEKSYVVGLNFLTKISDWGTRNKQQGQQGADDDMG